MDVTCNLTRLAYNCQAVIIVLIYICKCLVVFLTDSSDLTITYLNASVYHFSEAHFLARISPRCISNKLWVNDGAINWSNQCQGTFCSQAPKKKRKLQSNIIFPL